MLALVVVLLAASYGFAKRGPAPAAIDLEWKSFYIRISNTVEEMGYIRFEDRATGREILSLQVYAVLENPWLEADAQAIFIGRATIDCGLLLIENERGGRYSVDLESFEVRTIEGKRVYTL